VSLWLWFTGGHLLPYTGKEKVHYSYNTQRRMPVAGRTSQVTCDATGRIVDLHIEEGKGEIKQWILGVVEQWLPELSARPIAVFDREGYNSGFFSALVSAKQPFVTWDKNVDTSHLEAIAEERFTPDFQFNGKRYSVLEEEKAFCHTPPGAESHRFTLRYLIIWNHASNRRTAGLAYGGPHALSTEEATRAILSRWGASENTFKHIQDRHPWHYHPGFKLVDSDRQEIPNPQIRDKDKLITRLRKGLDKLLRKLVKTPQNNKSDGTSRRNSRRQRLLETIQQQEAMIEQVRAEKKALSQKIDVSKLQDYCSFKQVDNEGKYLFDFVTTTVWNVRKQIVDWLPKHVKSFVDLLRPLQRIPYQRTTQGVDIVDRGTDILGRPESLEVGEIGIHFRRRLGARNVLKHHLNAVDGQLLDDILDDHIGWDQTAIARSYILADGLVHVTERAARQQHAVLEEHMAVHGITGVDVL
jgi:hypothetical protein